MGIDLWPLARRKQKNHVEELDRIYGAFEEALERNTKAKRRLNEALEKNPEARRRLNEALERNIEGER